MFCGRSLHDRHLRPISLFLTVGDGIRILTRGARGFPTMQIRNFEPGDEAAQVGIYNEAAGSLPRFKPATLDEVRRRSKATDFDPGTRFYAVDGGQVVGYAVFQANGRVSYPWCRSGQEAAS